MGASKTRGADLFAAAVNASGHSQKTIGESLGVSQQTVSDWMKGDANPIHPKRLAIKDLFGIEPEAWASKDERAASRARPLPAPAKATKRAKASHVAGGR